MQNIKAQSINFLKYYSKMFQSEEYYNSKFTNSNPEFVGVLKNFLSTYQLSDISNVIQSNSKLSPQAQKEVLEFKQYLDSLQQQPVGEGVIYLKNQVPVELKASLMKNIDKLKEEQEIKDYHPGSNGIVRDIIHQSMYMYKHEDSKLFTKNQEQFYGGYIEELKTTDEKNWSYTCYCAECRQQRIADGEELDEDLEGYPLPQDNNQLQEETNNNNEETVQNKEEDEEQKVDIKEPLIQKTDQMTLNKENDEVKQDFSDLVKVETLDLVDVADNGGDFTDIPDITHGWPIYMEWENQQNYTFHTDFFGREFTTSNQYQWLPTNVKITQEQNSYKCQFESYVNNLPEDCEPLKENLEQLLSVFLPHFKTLIEDYVKQHRFSLWHLMSNSKIGESELIKKYEEMFRNKEFNLSHLQVFPKIVDYEMKPGQTYDGIWHVEGMSHENIIATGVYFMHIDDEIKGGQLHYKRNINSVEKQILHSHFNNQKDLQELFKPLGQLDTEQDNILIFPNSHIHQLTQIVNTHQTETKARRIVVFFLVNPYIKILSTASVPRQQEIISYEEACEWRLESMKERSTVKVQLNNGKQAEIVEQKRIINYCEH